MIPEAISPFQQAYAQRHQRARKWKEESRKVFGYLYSPVPEELLSAAGIIPVQLTESEEEQDAALGRTRLPDFYCDFILSILGQGMKGAYSYLDGLVIPDACNTIRRFAGSWKLNIPTSYFYYLTPPIEATQGARVYYTTELARFKQSLEDYVGKKITQAALRSAIEVYNHNRRLLQRLYQLRLQDRPPLSGSEVVEIVRAGLVIPKEEHNQMLEKLLQQIPAQPGKDHARTRLLASFFIFEDCASGELNVLKMVEEMGGEIVFDDLCLGPRYSWEPASARGDPLEALVARYLGNVTVSFRRFLDTRLGFLLEQARRYQVNGAVFIIPKYCDAYLLEHPYVEKAFKEAGIPTLMLETTESLATQQVRVRLQAFMEMLG